jgi:hypothetical protein
VYVGAILVGFVAKLDELHYAWMQERFKVFVFTFKILNNFAGIGLAGVVEYFQGRWLRLSASVLRAVFEGDVEYLAVIIGGAKDMALPATSDLVSRCRAGA